MQDTHVILTAFDVKGADRPAAHRALQERLVPLLESRDPSSPVESWWVAEDDRLDGSDNDSATFCELGRQEAAHDLLVAVGLAQAPQDAPELDAVEDWFVETTYNTDAEGNEAPGDDWGNRTLHGPFPGEDAARYFMEEVWPDGDTDVREQIRGPLNRPEHLTGPLTLPGQLSRRDRAELIRRAAHAWLYSAEPEGLDREQLREALGEPRPRERNGVGVVPVVCRVCGTRLRLADPESWVHDEDGEWGDHSAEPVEGALR